MKKIHIFILAITIFLVAGYFISFYAYKKAEMIRPSEKKQDLEINQRNPVMFIQNNQPEALITDLKVPWEIIFMPDGKMLVTERRGIVKISDVEINIPDVVEIGEGGLLGAALHPDFQNNSLIYFYFTNRTGGRLKNTVASFVFDGNQLRDKKIILDNIPASQNHNGGRLAFGPDGFLYITTGDAENSSQAQNRNSLAGKILRVRDDGSIPQDNPFGNAAWSYGHRNVQGIVWDDQGRLWATEHGRSGALSGYDELNLIKKGANYGWPEIQGDERRSSMESPVIHSGADDTWAPSGATYYKGSIFFAGLRGQAIYEYKISDNSLFDHFKGQFGRIRSVKIDQNGVFYVMTNNTDGRGMPRVGDDKILKIAK